MPPATFSCVSQNIVDSEIDEVVMDYDEVKIQHIIYNLLSNAIKFTKEGGKIILHVNNIEKSLK